MIKGIGKAITLYSIAVGICVAIVLYQEQLKSVYKMEQDANARLWADLEAPVQLYKEIFALGLEHYEKVFDARSQKLYQTARHFSEFDPHLIAKQGPQMFFIMKNEKLPQTQGCFGWVEDIPRHIYQDKERVILRYHCFEADGNLWVGKSKGKWLIGRIWDRNPSSDRTYITISSLDDPELGGVFPLSEYKATLRRILIEQDPMLKLRPYDYPRVHQSVMDGTVEVASLGLGVVGCLDVPNLNYYERFFDEGEHSAESENICNGSSMLISTKFKKDEFGVLSAVYKGFSTLKCCFIGILVALGGRLLGQVFLFVCRCVRISKEP